MPYILLSSVLAILIWSAPTFAMEIDEHCSVNIMNRTVQVQSDGTWQMNNVPSFMGRVRVRATCVNDGKTTSGQSEFFSLTTNNLTVVEDIFFDDPSPIPVALTFDDASTITLENTSTTTNLNVRATYSDGSFSPTLNASNGVNFISSNPNIVAIDDNGVLTAVSSGRVLITARLDGTVALKQVTASLSGDMDGDGLPDSYEIANGLDPNDPVDALEDQDSDGLNALAEFTAGTDINNNDTDQDGISDSEELIAGIDGFITNPLLADTDGDGFSDGLEVDLATDPSDSNSFDLANALESITVTPSTLILIFNGVDTEVSDQITVMANLIDGRQKDITASSFGTTYSSGDLTIASFGINDGEVFGGVAGTTMVTVSNNGYSDSITVNVERFDPIALSAISLPGYANNVDVQSDYAYVAAGSAGLVIVDVSDRTAPFIVSQLDTEGTAIDLKVSGHLVYLADGESGIKIIDVLDNKTPVLVSSIDTEGFSQDIAIDNNYIYIADGDNGLVIVNKIQLDTLFIESTLSSLGRVKGVDVELNRIAIASTSGLVLVDASDIQSPLLFSTTAEPQAKDVLLRGNYAYLSAYSSGYRVFDVSDMLNPIEVAGDRQIVPRDATIQGDLLLFAEQLFPNVVAYMNISEPENTVFQGTINLSPFGDYAGTGIAADNQYAYVTEESHFVRNDYGVSGNTKLFIARHRHITDNQGIAPVVNFIESGPPIQNANITVEVSAVDDLAVKTVEFSVDGEVVFVDVSAPYSMPLAIGADATGVLLSARAIDWGGNESTTEWYLPVLPDTDNDGLSDEDETNIYFTQMNNPDSDSDGLNDYREVLLGTNPNEVDSDGDQISDSDEVDNGTNPLAADTDDDGLSDFDELGLGTDPLKSDTDSDGLSDFEELDFNTDPLNPDTDGDGLADSDEINRYNTDPLNTDTDGDGASDFGEVAIGSDPNMVEVDSDGDGLPNERELEIGTDPAKPDTDGDTLLDIVELTNRTNPLAVDTDGDGVNDADDRVNDWYYFLNGDSASYQFGGSVSSAGDVNNDGVTDMIVGARYNGNGADSGSARVFSGVDSSVLYTFITGDSAYDQFGGDVSNAGDVNNDGVVDLIVGVHTDRNNGYNSGSARVFSGVDGSVLYTFNGDSAGDYFGESVSSAGDVNNDGFADVIVGARYDDNNGKSSGSARVLSGIDGSILYTFNGDSAGDYFGGSVSSAGDVNNDGFADLIIGAPYDDNNGPPSGSAQVFSGADGSILYTFSGDSAGDYFGESVSRAGDVNNDGFADLIVGAYQDDNNGTDSGSARVFSGVDGSVLYTFNGDSAGDIFGLSVSDAGDVNNDGFADIVVGAVGDDNNGYNSGSAQVFSGIDGSLIYTVYGYESYDRLGNSVSALGDIDNDGYADILVGVSSDNSARVISSNGDWDEDGLPTFSDPYPLIYMDATTDYDNDGLLDFHELNSETDVLDPDTDGDGLNDGDEVTYLTNPLIKDTDGDGLSDGQEVHVYLTQPLNPDTDGDGFADGAEVAVGANPLVAGVDTDGDGLADDRELMLGFDPSNPDTDGDSLLDGDEIANRTDPLRVDTDKDGVNDNVDTINDWYYFFHGDSVDDEFGGSVSSAGDVNNDGVIDVIVGAPYDDNNGKSSGSARVLSGIDGLILYTFNGDSAGDYFGGSVSGVGDVNSDGFADVIVGAHDDDNGGTQSGSARVFSGADGSILYTFTGAVYEQLGRSVSSAGDVNNDGFADIIVGSYHFTRAHSGSARVFSGADGSLLYTFTGDSAYDEFGRSVSGAGDVNNDGFADVIVGASNDDSNGTNSGRAQVFSGADGSLLYDIKGTSRHDYFGSSVSNVGDVNNDGFADVAVGAYGDDSNGINSGSVYVFSGVDGSALYTIVGDLPNTYAGYDYFGLSVSGAGDVNNDGVGDIVVGAYGDDNNFSRSGSASVFSGIDGSVIYTVNGYGGNDYLGTSVSSLGDIDNDGYADILVGASGDGSVRVISSNGDWDEDGLPTFSDPYPLIYMDATTDYNNDGVLDFDEILNGTDPLNPDSDGDGLTNNDEVSVYLSNPLSADSDNDGLPDKYEVDNGLNLIDSLDANGDVDGDGLHNLLEFILGADINNSDTDGDTLSDFEEYTGRTSPILVDTDKDGVADNVDTVNDWYYFFNGDSASDRFGGSVSSAGDVDNDGVIDIIVGAPYDNNNGVNSGSARVFSGADGSVLYTFDGDSPYEYFGTSVSAAGDVNNDGFADMIVGASSSAKVFSGVDGSVLYTFNGSSFSGAGDVNNDGFADIIVGNGTRYGGNSSRAQVFSGADGALLYTFNGDSQYDGFGEAVSSAGDVNNDGVVDLIVGVPGDRNNGYSSGSARVFSGADGSVLYTFYGDSADDYFGGSVSSAGDVNNDGFADMIVGAPNDDNNGDNSGSARIFSGVDGSVLYTFSGDSAGDRLGRAVSSAGDVNNDGFDDMVVGASEDDNNGTDSGSARVFSGIDGSIIYTAYGYGNGDQLGGSVSSLGDIDNDGYADILVGASGDGSARVISSNGDWDEDGVGTLTDPYPYIYMDATTDYDNDGLLDFDEMVRGTNPLNMDSDNDGLNDYDEVVVHLSNPLSADSDGDGLPDKLEVDLGLDLIDASDAEGDLDSDGLSNVLEYTIGTLLNNSDTDGDTLSDFEEYNSRTSPILVDTDKDGVADNVDTVNDWYYFFNGDSASDQFGGAVSRAGDVNNDGVADMIVGAPYSNDSSGSAQVFSGIDGSILYTFNGDSPYEYFGTSVSAAGDVNNDGFADMIVGASSSAEVFSGVDGSVLYTFNGNSFSGAGDVNNDGFADIIVGTPYDRSSGRAQIFSGVDGSLLYTFTGDSAYDEFGRSVSGAGDVNNDGFADMIVGAPYSNDDSGSAQVFSGIDGSLLYTFNTDSSYGGLGGAVSSAGDVNNDGFADMIVGAPYSNDYSGSAQVFSGIDGSLLYTFNGDSVSEQFGTSVSGADDVNNDGFADVIVGTPYDDDYSGSARVFSGIDGSVIYTVYGYGASDNLGSSVSALGDIDNDGYADILVGASGDGSARVISSNGDWDEDGVGTLSDSAPLDPAIQ